MEYEWVEMHLGWPVRDRLEQMWKYREDFYSWRKGRNSFWGLLYKIEVQVHSSIIKVKNTNKKVKLWKKLNNQESKNKQKCKKAAIMYLIIMCPHYEDAASPPGLLLGFLFWLFGFFFP